MTHQNSPPTSTRPKKQRRRVQEPTDALHEILTSHITPISSQQEVSHISTVVNVQDLLNQNGRDTAQTGRSRRTTVQSNDTNRMTVMNAATYGNYVQQQYNAAMIRFIPILTNFPTFLYVHLRSTYYDTHDPRNKTYHPIFGMQPTVWLEPTSEPTSTVTVAILHVQESKTFAPKSIRIGRFRSRTYF